MKMDFFQSLTPNGICRRVASNLRSRRKTRGFSQESLSRKSGVSLASLKRFENSGEISLSSLVKLAVVLACEEELTALFAGTTYSSIQDVLDEPV